MDYSKRKSVKLGVFLLWVTFDLQNGTFWPWKLTGSIAKVLTDVHEKFSQKLCQNPDHPKVHGLYHTKIVKMGGLPALGIFDLQNGTFWPWGLTGPIAKVLTNVHEIFLQKLCRSFRWPKSPWTIAHDNRQNKGFTWSGEDLTLKMGWFGREG